MDFYFTPLHSCCVHNWSKQVAAQLQRAALGLQHCSLMATQTGWASLRWSQSCGSFSQALASALAFVHMWCNTWRVHPSRTNLSRTKAKSTFQLGNSPILFIVRPQKTSFSAKRKWRLRMGKSRWTHDIWDCFSGKQSKVMLKQSLFIYFIIIFIFSMN